MAIELTQQADGVRLALKVVPGASRERIVGELGGALKIVVSQPPEGGAANKAVLKLLASALEIPASQITLVRGQSSPRKEIVVHGLTLDQLRTKLTELLGA